MSKSLEGRLRWRRTAPFHVQLELDQVWDPERASGEIPVNGLVVRVFRADGRLDVGDHIEFPLYVCHKGDEPTGPAFIYADALARAVYMEAYLAGTPPKCELVAYEFCVLDAPSDRPVMTPTKLEETEAGMAALYKADRPMLKRRNWRFWRRN